MYLQVKAGDLWEIRTFKGPHGDQRYLDLTQATALEKQLEETGLQVRIIVDTHEMVPVIRCLHTAFENFHLSPCYCGAPVWQQPCPVCRYYPMYGQTNSVFTKPGLCSSHRFTEEIERRGSLFEWYLQSFQSLVAPPHEALSLAKQRTKNFSWPSGDDIWRAFSKSWGKVV